MATPRASRPYMPGYGVPGPAEETGLLPWSWAEERLIASRNYWVVTSWPDGRPHAMPVWGVWDTEQDVFWFTSSLRSRKIRNISADPRCTVAIENAVDPVIVDGSAKIITQLEARSRLIELVNDKYSTDYSVEMLDPSASATVCVSPHGVFALIQDDFSGSPTRWTFG